MLLTLGLVGMGSDTTSVFPHPTAPPELVGSQQTHWAIPFRTGGAQDLVVTVNVWVQPPVITTL